MFNYYKKSQISILIIIAIVMFIFMAIFITSKTNHDVANLQEPISNLNPEPVKEHVNLCIEEIVKEGMWKYGTSDIIVLEEFLNDNLLGCVVDLNEYSAGVSILAGRVESSILPTNDNEYLNMDVNMPLSIEATEQSLFLEKFKVKTFIEPKINFDLGSVTWSGTDYSGRNVESSLSVAPGGIGIEYTQSMLNTTCGEPEDMDWGTVVFFWLSGDTWYGKTIEHLTGCRPSNTKNGLHYVNKPKDPGELPLGWRTCYNSRTRDKEGKLLSAKDAAIPLKGEEVHYLVIESGGPNRTSTAEYIMPYDNKCGASHKDDVLTSEYTRTSLNVNVEAIGDTDSDGFLSMIEFLYG